MKKILLTFLLLSITSCATQTFRINDNKIDNYDEETQIFFFNGIAQEQEINAARICGGVDKIVKVETKLEFVDFVIASLTSGIVTPRNAKVYCSK